MANGLKSSSKILNGVTIDGHMIIVSNENVQVIDVNDKNRPVMSCVREVANGDNENVKTPQQEWKKNA